MMANQHQRSLSSTKRLADTHSSLLAAHGTMKTPRLLIQITIEGQEKQPAEADQLYNYYRLSLALKSNIALT